MRWLSKCISAIAHANPLLCLDIRRCFIAIPRIPEYFNCVFLIYAPEKSEASFSARRAAATRGQVVELCAHFPNWSLERAHGAKRGKQQKTARRLGARTLNVCILEQPDVPHACRYCLLQPKIRQWPSGLAIAALSNFFYSLHANERILNWQLQNPISKPQLKPEEGIININNFTENLNIAEVAAVAKVQLLLFCSFGSEFDPTYVKFLKLWNHAHQGARERSEGKCLSNVEKAWWPTALAYTLKWASEKLKYSLQFLTLLYQLKYNNNMLYYCYTMLHTKFHVKRCSRFRDIK